LLRRVESESLRPLDFFENSVSPDGMGDGGALRWCIALEGAFVIPSSLEAKQFRAGRTFATSR
jgi:hypothetical protein